MFKSEVYALLGMKLKHAIQTFHYPTPDTDIFSPHDYMKIRTQLYKAPANNDNLGKNMIRIFLNGTIEEIKETDNALIFDVQFDYKAEVYIAELKLEGYKWGFESLQYIGELPPSKRVGLWLGSAVVAVLILLFSSLVIIDYFEKREQTELLKEIGPGNQFMNSVPDSSESIEPVPLEELEKLAKEMDLVLISEEQYKQFLEDQESALAMADEAEQIENLIEQEREDAHQFITITVQPGMKAYHVAKLLVENKLAETVDDIQHYFIEQNIQYRIRSGSHQIPADATYADIARILTTRE